MRLRKLERETIRRDSNGEWMHSRLIDLFEGVPDLPWDYVEKWMAHHGTTIKLVSAPPTVKTTGKFKRWHPEPPTFDNWDIVALIDSRCTGDGFCALMVKTHG